MNIQQLHTLKDFASLATDPRFISLVNHLREMQPMSSGGDAHHLIRDAGRGEGWKMCVDQIEKALTPPAMPFDPNRPQPYTRTQTAPDTTANQK